MVRWNQLVVGDGRNVIDDWRVADLGWNDVRTEKVMDGSWAYAFVKCRDGKTRKFVATVADEFLTFAGNNWDYILLDDPENGGFSTRRIELVDGRKTYPLARKKFQPRRIVCSTQACDWHWVRIDTGKKRG